MRCSQSSVNRQNESIKQTNLKKFSNQNSVFISLGIMKKKRKLKKPS